MGTISLYFESVDVNTKRKIVLGTIVITSLGILGASGVQRIPVNFNAPFFNIQGIKWGYVFVLFNILGFLWIQNKNKGGV